MGMLRWSPGAVRATVGVGGLGLMVFVMELLARAGLTPPYPLLFVVALGPMLLFVLANLVGRTWARRAQGLAIVWYAIGSAISVVELVLGGFKGHDLLFIAFVALGAWPCIAAARSLARGDVPAALGPQALTAMSAAAAPEPGKLVLKGRRGKSALQLVGGVVLAACGLLPGLRHEQPFLAWSCVAFFGLCSALIALRLAFPSAFGTLTLDAAGFTTATFGRKHLMRWSDVTDFGLLHVHGNPMISIAYSPAYEGQRRARKLAASLTGVEGGLQDIYEISGLDLVAVLRAWHARYRAS
jgi:hypothetical protein